MGKVKTVHKSPEVENFSTAMKTSADTAKDQLQGFVPDFFEQLMGFSVGGKSEHSGTEKAQEPLVVRDPGTGAIELFNASNQTKHDAKAAHHEKAAKAESRKEAAIDHAGEIRTSSERAAKVESREITQRLEQIMVELRRLVSSSKVLQTEFANVNLDQTPPQAGEYHINFFDWLLLTIRTAREKVENSGAWLATAKGKSGKKRWGNKERKNWFGNTSLSMSNESGGGIINQTG